MMEAKHETYSTMVSGDRFKRFFHIRSHKNGVLFCSSHQVEMPWHSEHCYCFHDVHFCRDRTARNEWFDIHTWQQGKTKNWRDNYLAIYTKIIRRIDTTYLDIGQKTAVCLQTGGFPILTRLTGLNRSVPLGPIQRNSFTTLINLLLVLSKYTA